MLSVQNNFGYVHGSPEVIAGAGASVPVSFAAANTAANGLIVVAYCLTLYPGWSTFPHSLSQSTPLSFNLADSSGNAYESLGACGRYDGSQWTSLMQAWYVKSCIGGANTVTLAETMALNDYALALSVFEYPGTFGAADAVALATGLSPAKLSLTLKVSAAGELLFGFAAQYGVYGSVALDAGSTGYSTEQAAGIWSWITPNPEIVPMLAVARIVQAAGVTGIVFDYTHASQEEGLAHALCAALPISGPSVPPPSPTPPAPPSPIPPVLGAGQSWPTIF
jgi:hypothetical protein